MKKQSKPKPPTLTEMRRQFAQQMNMHAVEMNHCKAITERETELLRRQREEIQRTLTNQEMMIRLISFGLEEMRAGRLTITLNQKVLQNPKRKRK